MVQAFIKSTALAELWLIPFMYRLVMVSAALFIFRHTSPMLEYRSTGGDHQMSHKQRHGILSSNPAAGFPKGIPENKNNGLFVYILVRWVIISDYPGT